MQDGKTNEDEGKPNDYQSYPCAGTSVSAACHGGYGPKSANRPIFSTL